MAALTARPGGWAAIAAVLGLLLSSCGESGSDRPAVRDDEAAVRAVLDDAVDALYEGDGERACSLYTDAYRRELVKENQADSSPLVPKGDSCKEQVRDYEPIVKRVVPDRKVNVVWVRVKGDRATAFSEFNTIYGRGWIKEFLVREGGSWKIDGDQETGEGPPLRHRQAIE